MTATDYFALLAFAIIAPHIPFWVALPTSLFFLWLSWLYAKDEQ